MNPKLVGIAGPFKGTTFPVPEGKVSIGRESANQLWITDPALSRKHCELFRDGETFTIRDLQSHNGTLVEVIERSPPTGLEPVHWSLLTTHDVPDIETAWRIVDWYRQRWLIEQLFRTLKKQGYQIEDSQIVEADNLLKLIAIATKAAAVTLQLVQARDGNDCLPASAAFHSSLIPALDAINARYHATTRRQINPHPHGSMAWAAWIIARLGGWDGYPSSRPPGPITFKHGLDQFHAIASGWVLRDVSTP